MATESQRTYEDRERRVMDAIALKRTDRIPVLAVFGTFALEYGGLFDEADMFDTDTRYAAHFKAHMELQPDMAALWPYPALLLETLDFRQLGEVGHAYPSDLPSLTMEGEPMKDYEDFLYDPSDFLLRTYCVLSKLLLSFSTKRF